MSGNSQCPIENNIPLPNALAKFPQSIQCRNQINTHASFYWAFETD